MTRFKGHYVLGVILFTLASAETRAADWPAWRQDASRSAVSPEALPESLSARWVCRYPPPRSAWPDPRLQFDAAFQPVVAGKTLVFGSSSDDCVIVQETGGPNLGLVKECRGVRASNTIRLRLAPKAGKTLLCGVELIAEE